MLVGVGRYDPSACRPLDRQRIRQALYLKRIRDTGLLLSGKRKRCPMAGIFHALPESRGERYFELDHSVDAVRCAAGDTQSRRDLWQERFTIELHSLAAGADEAVGELAGQRSSSRPRCGDIDPRRYTRSVVDRRILRPIVSAVITDPLFGP